MKTEIWLISESAAEALAYALLHSLWQGLIIFLVLKSVLMFISQEKPTYRYAAAACSLLMLFITFVATCFLLHDPVQGQSGLSAKLIAAQPKVNGMSQTHITGQLSSTVGLYKEYILVIWAAGYAIGLVRLVAGYSYLIHLKTSSIPVNAEWMLRLNDLSKKLRLKTTVILAESSRVSAPLVIGFIKPFILLPAGLSSWLSSEQLEAILIHELMHVKRNDFLLNLFQTFLEALLFFNPFIWMISAILRTEREHCCDDAVIGVGADRKAYVKALAALQESRMTTTLALSIIGNENQLLQRIKRLMEKSVKNYSLKEKAVPVVLLFVGLVCASWFSIQKGSGESKTLADDKVVAADTSIRKKQKAASYSRKKTTPVTPDGKFKEEIVEDYDGDDDLRPMTDEMTSFDVVIPPIPDFDFPPALELPGLAEVAIPPFPDMAFSFDTIPPYRLSPRDWQTFEKEFTQQFQEKFGNFYQENQGQFQEMMTEFERNFALREETIAELEALNRIELDFERNAQVLAQHEKSMRKHEEHMREFDEQMRDWEKKNDQHLKELEKNMKSLEEKMKNFSKKLKDELVQDGYLKESDEIREMHWDDDGNIEINDIKIKDSDLKKYRALHKKYFEGKEEK